MKVLQYICFIFCLLFCLSCASDESCRTDRSVLLDLVNYHVTDNDTTRTTATMNIDSLTVKALKLDTLTGKYAYLDSIIYNNQKTVGNINLPLNNFARESIYEITFNKTIVTGKKDTISFKNTKDTLTILHENKDNYISLECGCIKVHSIDTAIITKHFVDSIRIINHTVNNINAENIRIYK